MSTPTHFGGQPRQTVDVAIIGGGIVGLFTAFLLARSGRRVALFEQGEIWSEASAVNAGSLGVQNKLNPLVPYTLWSWEIWQKLATEFGIDAAVKRSGGYKIALTDEEAERLGHSAAEQARLGLTVEMLTRKQIEKQAAWLSAEVTAAAYSPDDGSASPTKLGPALAKAALACGVQIFSRTPVFDINPGPRVEINTSEGAYFASQLAITTGAWTQGVGAMLGATLPVELDVNMVTVTEPAAFTIGGLVSHARGILTLKQVANGSCLIGGGWQGVGTLEDRRKDIDHDQLVQNIRLALQVVPGLRQLNALRSWAGYEGVTPDSLPYIGHLGGQENIFVAACARGGFTLGPAMARLLSELMSKGRTTLPIDIFDPARFEND